MATSSSSTKSADVDSDPRFDAFRRCDIYGDLGKGPLPFTEKLRLYVLAVLLAPIRLLLALLLLLLFYFNLKMAVWIPAYGRARMSTLVGRLYTRVCLAVLGLVYIRREDLCPPGTKNADDQFPSLIVSNHVSWLDTVIHFYLSFPASFVMKQGVFKVPIIGDIGWVRIGASKSLREM